MSDAVVTGIFGTLILGALAYLSTRIDRVGERVDRLSDRVEHLAERVARIEGRLDERSTP